MPARILSIPFFIMLMVAFYLSFWVDSRYSWLIIAPAIILAMIYVSSPQINWQWYRRYPPDLPGVVHQMLFRYSFYQRLPEGEKKRFRHRVALFAMANEFIPKGMEKVPDDLKYITAACAVTLTFGQKDFLFKKFEHVVIAPRPFPSPQYPERFHASETYEPDGVVLFAAEQLVMGFMQSSQYFNIGLYEYAKVFVASHPNAPYPEFDEEIWARLERISEFSRDWIGRWINLPGIDPLAVSIAHFFTFPERFLQELPEIHALYQHIFGLQK